MNGNAKRKIMQCEIVFKSLEVFNFKDLQTFNTICKILEREKVSLTEFQQCLEERRLQIEKDMLEFRKLSPSLPCPKCGENAYLYRVNTPKGKANVYGWKVVWVCSGASCAWYKYSKKVINNIKRAPATLKNCGGKANGTR
jgi:predicted RNA-binding Zn-ribbon protein involved in translation (DUF1610 family)